MHEFVVPLQKMYSHWPAYAAPVASMEMNLHKYASGSMLDEQEFKDLFAQWVPIASSLFIRGNVGVEISDSYFPLRSKMAVDCGAERMYFVCENVDRAKVMEKTLLGEPDYARRIMVVT